MRDFVTAFGLVLVIEGLMWAALPGIAMRLLRAAGEMPPEFLRIAGAAAIAAGVATVWLARG